MSNRTASKFFAAAVAAVSLSMVTSVSPADAAKNKDKDSGQVLLRDTGWNRP
jgi:hypothetical protein